MLYLLVFLSLSSLTLSDTISCGNKVQCNSDGGQCVYFENVKETCICSENFETYPEDNSVMCNYKRKSALTAMLLELFLPMGVGHYYSEHFFIGVLKSVFFIINFVLWFMVKYYTKRFEKNDNTTMLYSIISCFWCFGLMFWYVLDVFMFALNVYADGNGILMES